MRIRIDLNERTMPQRKLSEILRHLASALHPMSGYNMDIGDAWPVYGDDGSNIGRIFIERTDDEVISGSHSELLRLKRTK